MGLEEIQIQVNLQEEGRQLVTAMEIARVSALLLVHQLAPALVQTIVAGALPVVLDVVVGVAQPVRITALVVVGGVRLVVLFLDKLFEEYEYNSGVCQNLARWGI